MPLIRHCRATSMLPAVVPYFVISTLHPAVVQLPFGLAAILPGVVIGFAWARALANAVAVVFRLIRLPASDAFTIVLGMHHKAQTARTR